MGVELSKDLALRTRSVVQFVEQQRGESERTANGMPAFGRPTRFYKTPPGGIPAPAAGQFMISSADCRLLKINDDNNQLVETNTDEKVYSLEPIAGDTLIEVSQINGVPFAKVSAVSSLTIQAPAAGIPAAINYQYGSAVCSILQADDTDTWDDTGRTETIYNPSTEIELTEGLRQGWAIWDGSRYVLISKLCGDNRAFEAAQDVDIAEPATLPTQNPYGAYYNGGESPTFPQPEQVRTGVTYGSNDEFTGTADMSGSASPPIQADGYLGYHGIRYPDPSDVETGVDNGNNQAGTANVSTPPPPPGA